MRNIFLLGYVLSLAACSLESPSPRALTVEAIPNATPTDIWFAIQERTPYPYSTPLPQATTSPIDGTYVKAEPVLGVPVHCLRCPDYASDGGIWLLRFDKGIYRIYSELTEWRTLGSFSVSGERILLFNDGYCGDEVGTYTWSLVERKLVFKEVKDDCSIHLRAKNLTFMPWESCLPPNREAAVSGHWQVPLGCR